VKTSLAAAPLPDSEETDTALAERASREEELRAMRALRILLESKLIDQLEFERRLATFQNNLPVQAQG
jgi:hypothetical protein